MNRPFENKVALVTGAGQGMGLVAARAFAEAGAAVALADRDEALVQKAAQVLTKEGYKAIAIRCDVTNEQQVLASAVSTAGLCTPALLNAASSRPNSATVLSTISQ